MNPLTTSPQHAKITPVTLVLIAKETIPGKVKTRLHPPLSLTQAAELASAAIGDTLRALAPLPAVRRVLLFDGDLTPEDSGDYEVLNQVSGTLDERLAAMFDTVDGPTLLIGMDTPQVSPADLAPVFAAWPDEVDAFFGPATDGGFWALGLAKPDGALVRGIPMSRDDTGARQLERLRSVGLRVELLPTLSDVDTFDDAVAVAALAPTGTFAATLARFVALDPALVLA